MTSPLQGGDLAGLNGTVGLSLSSGQYIRDAVGNALPAVEPATDETYLLDNSAPTVTSAASTTVDGTYGVGGVINITVNFSESISSAAGLTISLDSGGSVTTGPLIAATSFSGTYTVVAGQNSTDLNVSSIAGTITDAASNNTVNPAVPGANIADSKNIIIDTAAPTLTSFTRQTPATSPTNADTLVFRVTFNADVQNVDAGDFSASGTTAGLTVASVSASVYDITVTGGNLSGLNGTVGLDLAGGQNIADMAGNALPAGEPATDETYILDNTTPALTSLMRQTPATSLTNADTLVFRVTFSVDVQNVNAADFVVTGTTATITGVAGVGGGPNYTQYDLTLSGGDLADLNDTVGLDLAGAQDITDLAGNAMPTVEPVTDETYEVNNTAPLVANTNLSVSYTEAGPSSFIVVFNENVNNAGGGAETDDASNPANYVVMEQGSVNGFQTAACNSIDAVQDARVLPSGVTYIPNTAIVNLGSALPIGSYRLFICGTTSIVDLAGNHLNNGVDVTFDFVVNVSKNNEAVSGNGNGSDERWLPNTGFAPNIVTSLPEQPAELTYTKMSDLWLEIPSQGVKANIVGVPQSENAWDVKWLGNDAGWLNGTAFPSWVGNSMLTAHVMGADGLPGPFANLQDLQYGEQVIVHILDQQYVFEVRNKRLVRPDSTAFAFEHLEDASYLTLITCSGYNEESNTYSYRRIIRAVLVEVK